MSNNQSQLLRQLCLPSGISGEIWLGPMPGRVHVLASDIAELQSRKIDRIVSLTPRTEIATKSPEYGAALTNGLGIDVTPFPIEDFGVPNDELALLRLAVQVATDVRRGDRIFIHCAAGIGRTGTVAAIVLAALGIADAHAAQLVEQAGSRPETEPQRLLIFRLSKRLSSGHAGI